MKVKICGITNVEDALAATNAGVDALGFIFYPKSKRYVQPETVRTIVQALPPFVTTVGVMVNVPRDEAERTLDETGLQILQIHGDETPAQCQGYSRPVIRALRVGETFTAADIEPYAEAGVESFLLDTDKDGFYGGTGKRFDWKFAVLAREYGRVILSGGLTPDNVEEAIQTVSPYAVDTGSGVEASPGTKDHNKIKAFIENAVRAGRES